MTRRNIPRARASCATATTVVVANNAANGPGNIVLSSRGVGGLSCRLISIIRSALKVTVSGSGSKVLATLPIFRNFNFTLYVRISVYMNVTRSLFPTFSTGVYSRTVGGCRLGCVFNIPSFFRGMFGTKCLRNVSVDAVGLVNSNNSIIPCSLARGVSELLGRGNTGYRFISNCNLARYMAIYSFASPHHRTPRNYVNIPACGVRMVAIGPNAARRYGNRSNRLYVCNPAVVRNC